MFFFRQNQTLSLNNLQVGVYQFKVIVSGGSPPVHGVGFGNVTVSPRKFSLISNLVFQSFQNLFGVGGLSYKILFVSVLALVLSETEERLETTLGGRP